MKIKDDFVMRKMADTTVVVPVGSNAIDFNGMINLNETGAFLFEILQQGATNEELVSKLLDEYDVSREQACKDVDIFVKKLKDADIIE
ncbi:MAG: PqqD family protein [Ruminococcus sp.]